MNKTICRPGCSGNQSHCRYWPRYSGWLFAREGARLICLWPQCGGRQKLEDALLSMGAEALFCAETRHQRRMLRSLN